MPLSAASVCFSLSGADLLDGNVGAALRDTQQTRVAGEELLRLVEPLDGLKLGRREYGLDLASDAARAADKDRVAFRIVGVCEALRLYGRERTAGRFRSESRLAAILGRRAWHWPR